MDALLNIFTAFGLSSSAGLNAYIPLLMTGLVARYTNLLTLQQPFDLLENPWVLGTLGILLVVELFVDKIPVLDSVNDLLHTIIRPAAGAVLFAANAGVVSDLNGILALVLGLLTAGGVHTTKTAIRPAVTATTAGVGNPVVSFIEDILAFVASLVAILMPFLVVVLAAIALFFIIRWRRGGGEQALPEPPSNSRYSRQAGNRRQQRPSNRPRRSWQRNDQRRQRK